MSLISNNKIKIFSIILLIIYLGVPSALADNNLDVWGHVNPEGVLAPGDEVFCYYSVEYNFNSDRESLEFYTDLSDPRWQFTISIDGAEQEKPKDTGRYESISGFELYYPGSYQTIVRVRLNGTVPDVSSTGNYSIFDVAHYDAAGKLKSEESVERTFINPSDLSGIQDSAEARLYNLRSKTDNLRSLGVDTFQAEKKYTQASNAVSTAKNSAPSVQSSLLSSAVVFMDEAERLLDISWTDYSIEDAEKKTGAVDSMISYYENSAGLSSDSRVWVIKSYNDNAKTLLVLAGDKYKYSDYELARNYASQAADKAIEAHNYALELNSELNLNAPEQNQNWNIQTSAFTSAPTLKAAATSVHSGSPSGTEVAKQTDDIDSLLHSEVDVESFLKIAGKIYELLLGAFEIANDLIASASDN